MSVLSVLLAIMSIMVPSFPFGVSAPYLSNTGVRADRVLAVPGTPKPPAKRDVASLGPRLSAQSAIVVDAASGAVLFQKNPRERRPMASIAKLATALVVMDEAPNLEALFTMEESDDREGGEEFIRPGESAKLRDFLVASLLGSANNATISLSRSVEPDARAFVARMNRKAGSLGMVETLFTEPSGLAPENTSTAWDIAKLIAAAGESEVIKESIGTHRADITVHPTGALRTVRTTNHLMGGIVLVEYGKTGHLEASGYNLAAAVQTKEGRSLYIVTLGSETNEDRIQDAKNLAVWAENTYAWE